MTFKPNKQGIPVRVEPEPERLGEVTQEKDKDSAPATELPTGQRNAPVDWGQFLGGLASDYLSPAVIVPTGFAILGYIETPGTLQWRAVIIIALGAYLTALAAIAHITGTTGLMLRLRAKGQIQDGK